MIGTTNKAPKVYIGGKIDGRVLSEVVKERQKVSRLLAHNGFKPIDPLLLHFSPQKSKNCVISPERYLEIVGMTPEEIVRQDKALLKKSDVLFVITGDIPSWGTILEIGYMLYHLRRKVVVFSPKNLVGVWVRTEVENHGGKICRTFSQAIYSLRHICQPLTKTKEVM